MKFLKGLALEADVEEKPAEEAAPTQTQQPAPTSQPAPSAQAPAAPSGKEPSFTDEQIASMQDIKTKMKLKDNDELNPFIQDWSFGQGQTWEYLDENNINGFIQFMKDQYLT